ncbi:Low molecular weight protein-tyrosine-phosphatase Wzb [invertebrate metagenome]|uniref:Low molecular weight protein-tyrosine-phosphatase Wzb n=1 Tax=invertebrate metagenome TaxID=1711999 RepID=A0A2H9T5J2_9ZZZZ
MFSTVLVVCVGNICRSPTAEFLLRQRIHEKRVGKNEDASQARAIQVSSAGLGALVNHKADVIASRIAESIGLDLSTHIARQLDREMVHQNDLILVMEEAHIRSVEQLAPEARGKVHLMGRWYNNIEIPDPYRRGKAAYQRALDLIIPSAEGWVDRLVR